MDDLDYFERESGRTFAALQGDYSAAFEKLFKLVSALVVGGGATASIALTRLADKDAALIQWLPLAVLSACWFATVGLLLVGMRSRELSSGPSPGSIAINYKAAGGIEQRDAEDLAADAKALRALRWSQLYRLDAAIDKQVTATNARAWWLSMGLVGVALSVAISAVVAYWCAINPQAI